MEISSINDRKAISRRGFCGEARLLLAAGRRYLARSS
jgi:hypothetical protein